MKELEACHIGHLVKTYGTVTHCSDAKPLMQVAVYTCEECGFEIYQELSGIVSMPLSMCPSNRCKINRINGSLTRSSKCLWFQEAKIQELAEHIPEDHIPRTMTVHFMGELTRKVCPGDIVTLSGVFLPILFSGSRAIRAGMTACTYLEAMSVNRIKIYDDIFIRTSLRRQIDPTVVSHTALMAVCLNGILLLGSETKVGGAPTPEYALKFVNIFDCVTQTLCESFMDMLPRFCARFRARGGNLDNMDTVARFVARVISDNFPWNWFETHIYHLELLLVGSIGDDHATFAISRHGDRFYP